MNGGGQGCSPLTLEVNILPVHRQGGLSLICSNENKKILRNFYPYFLKRFLIKEMSVF